MLNKLFSNGPRLGGLTKWNQFFEKMNSMFWKELVFSKDEFHDFNEVFVETRLLSFERHGKLWVVDNYFHINPLLAPHLFILLLITCHWSKLWSIFGRSCVPRFIQKHSPIDPKMKLFSFFLHLITPKFL